MKQILQNIKTGKLNVTEVPEPSLAGPGVLVATQASIISAGTERMITEFAQKSLIGKAIAKPNEVKRVIDKIKRDGLRSTWHSVFSRLSQPMPLGYSASGVVIAKSPEVTNVNPGDKVACGGAGHAEVIFVPKNLVVPVPDNVDFDSAAFATLGSIAMQGIRVAELVMGEKVVVIGLGLLGLITIQLAKAAGCRVIGADVNPAQLQLAEKLACDKACTPGQLPDVVAELTSNIGADAVIITAATKSNQPTELAATVSRKKGRISVVGAVKMDIPRGLFYEKELQLRISTSYGPGRYDSQYEEKGIDYPYAYVPWTEQRNMACVIDLISQGKLDVKSLITHTYPVEQAEDAYKLVRGEISEPYLGIVLNYPKVEDRQPTPVVTTAEAKAKPLCKDKVGIGVIGSGIFANITMLPAMKKIDDYERVGIADINGSAAKHSQDKFGFSYSAGDHHKILEDENIDVVFVTTRHNTHASLLLEALQAGKHVMVEKPLCLTEDELGEIIKIAEQKPELLVMVGFNRRFAPMSLELKARIKNKGPLCMNYICNAGFAPKDSWTQDVQVGGGRIIGEGCHFIDWMIWLTGSAPKQVYAQAIARENSKALKDDNIMILITFEDGSIGTVSYLACGDKSYTKEHIEVYAGGSIGIINDFRNGFFTCNGKKEKLTGLSKGHFEEWSEFASAIKNGGPSPIGFEEIVASTWTTLKAIESLKTAKAVKI
jgi:predicted dehydrogenase/threonine dehydrogenase-like Zn-dependent dehydrogenase